jgi:pimeloyl-ACP methyl ester carboxylesterase
MGFERFIETGPRRFIALLTAFLLALMATTSFAHDRDKDPWHHGKGPLLLKRTGNFFVGGERNADGQQVGQMYVEYQIPLKRTKKYPVVLVHGGGQIGAAWWQTPDGREGWGQYFVRRGYAVYVVDQPARGRSPYHSSLGLLGDASGSLRVQTLWAAQERFNPWPAAHLHTQWPGPATDGDPAYEQFLASQSDALGTPELQERLTADGLVALLDRIGPSILVPHSQPGAPAWLVADRRPHLVKALVQLEPGGPPVYRDGPPAFTLGPTFAWGLTRNPITYSPAVTDPTQLQFERVAIDWDPYVSSVWLQKEPARKLVNVKKVPVLLLTAPSGYNTEWDPGTHAYLKQAGVKHTWLKLAEIGIHGNGHFMFIEKNSDQVAGVVQRWIERNVHRRKGHGYGKHD